VAKILFKFELEGRVYGGDERRKMRTKGERRERGYRVLWGGVTIGRRERKG